VREKVLSDATHCSICGGLLDFDAPARSKWSPSVDHVDPLALGGDPFALSNLRASHLGCNASRGVGRRPARRKPAPNPVQRANWF
jgi:hypothetical protein